MHKQENWKRKVVETADRRDKQVRKCLYQTLVFAMGKQASRYS
jgi:hypothetical protein